MIMHYLTMELIEKKEDLNQVYFETQTNNNKQIIHIINGWILSVWINGI